ncbi:MAG: TatD family hydrolase [Desulfovibrio sp.]|jgi:TatD DNase family protein|nr:TatD family hydrolase [Desulfovibrio sp.]
MSKKKAQAFYPPPELPHTGVDAHAHLDDRRFRDDFGEVVARASAAGVAQIIQVFLSPEAWEEGRALFTPYPQIYFTLGVHPNEADTYGDAAESGIRAAVKSDPRIRAIGEIGLDYYRQSCLPRVQQEVFARQLRLARELDLPVVIHCRDAEEDTLALLEAAGFAGYPTLWHCFGGDADTARRILAGGRHISLPGPLTYPANRELRAAAAEIPLDRLMTETDCPYLAPSPLRGTRNEPANTAYVLGALAEARGMAPGDLWTVCGDNARRFFGIDAGCGYGKDVTY